MSRFVVIAAASVLLASPCWASHQRFEYAYDGLGRLQSVTNTDTGTKITYTYDSEGNRTRVEVSGAVPAARRYDTRDGNEVGAAVPGGNRSTIENSTGFAAPPPAGSATRSASPAVTATPTPEPRTPTPSPTPTPDVRPAPIMEEVPAEPLDSGPARL